MAGRDGCLHESSLRQRKSEPLMRSCNCASVWSAAASHVRCSACRRAARAEPVHQLAVSGQREILRGQRRRVAVRNQPSGGARAHRVAQARTVGGDRRRAAGGRLHDRDTPPFLGRRKDVRPGTAEEPQLLLLAHEAEESHRIRLARRSRPAASARRGDRHRRRCRAEARAVSFRASASAWIATSTFLYRFSLPTYTKVGSAVRPTAGSGRYRTQSTPGWITRMRCASTPPCHQVVARALADRVEPRPAVGQRKRLLRQPDRGRHRPGRLLEGRAPEQVRDDRAERQRREAGEEQRQLVDVLARPHRPAPRRSARRTAPRALQRERVPPAEAVHLDAPHHFPWPRRRPSWSRPAAPGDRAPPAGVKISKRWISAPPACGLRTSCQLTSSMFTDARAYGRPGRARRSRTPAPGHRRTSAPAAPPRRSRPWAARRPCGARGSPAEG